jgi:hypothetical protein
VFDRLVRNSDNPLVASVRSRNGHT